MGLQSAIPVSSRFRKFLAIGRVLLLLIAFAAVGFNIWLVLAERVWDAGNIPQATPAKAFVSGSIGTELAPLVVMEVLPELFPEEFHPVDALLGKPPGTSGDWVDQYGFIRKSAGDKQYDDETGLPVGFLLSNHRPGSGAPSPVPFVGLSCTACHSTEIRTDISKPGKVVYGVGNSSMNLLAFSEAIRGVLTKRTPDSKFVLTLEAVKKAHGAKNRELTTFESIMTKLWIDTARSETIEYSKVIDDPLPPDALFDPRWIPAGPIRTQPFRSLVRIHLDRPGMSSEAALPDHGFSKIPAVYHQDHEFHGEWAQFDGSVRDLVARSTLAASTAGANVHNLALPDLSANIKNAAEYTRKLAPPRWEEVFGYTPDAKKVASGKVAYQEHCYNCHGGPDGKDGWTWNKSSTDKIRFGDVTPWRVLGTDAERLHFRHATEIPPRVYAKFVTDFRKDHPLATFSLDDMTARTGDALGYYNGPISGAFLRAPYLHNASVLTLAELIGLEQRRPKFYRGRNAYDTVRVGLISPPVPEEAGGVPPGPGDKDHYFVFDTAVRGNSAGGHRYPEWGFGLKPGESLPPDRKQMLEDLLEYLKTL
jgi:hypothetical protein